jgi:hypothetical protein
MLVRNLPDAGSLDEAEPDSGDFAILGQANSGIISGGAVTATAPESMAVNLGAARVVIGGTPYTFGAQDLTLTPSSGGANRFDLVGWTSAGPAFITGDANANPEFPDFDPATYVVGAAVYVGQSVTVIAQERITEKINHVLASFKRQFTAEDEVVVDLTTPLKTSGFQVLSDGRLKWVNSVLKRLGDQAVEFLTTLTMKQPLSSVAALVVKAATGATGAHTLVKIEAPGSSTAMATIYGDGRIDAPNYRRGTGTPNGVVSGIIGDLYVDKAATNANLAVWVKMTASGTSGWQSLRSYVANESSFPTGALVPWSGLTTDPIPVGFSLCQGGNLAINASTQDLADLIGERFGTAPEGFVKLPDLRNRVVGGASTSAVWAGVIDDALTVGTTLGQNVWQLVGSQVPIHNHAVTDPGHTHPQEGPRWYYKPGIYGFPAFRPGGTGTPNSPGQWVEDQYFNRSAKTGISTKNYGGGDPLVMMQATIGMNWLVKW